MAIEILKRRADYALRALVGLAASGDEVVSARALAKSEKLSESLLRKLLQDLVRAELVESVQGTTGGFRLAKAPAGISVLEVAEAVQGKLVINRCFLGRSVCPRQGKCKLSPRLVAVQEHLVEFMGSLKLSDLMAADTAGSSG